MEFVNVESLDERAVQLRERYLSKRPFHYVVFDNFFYPEKAEEVHQSYPRLEDGKWNGTTYVDQKNKFQQTSFDPGSTMDKVFKELNSVDFVKWLEKITEINGIIPDEQLFGGGLHQSIKGAFLNVHVDYNVHPQTSYHRRLNVLIYMNKDWTNEYEGLLELWDMSGEINILLEKVMPSFNKCVIFETNEKSFHGHPRPLNTPEGVNRKSIATYYYTKTRPESEIAPDHNTLYVNTEGVKGQAKRFSSGLKALVERIKKP
jgi:Rps23 Pro-64 3,4-dihydroxylase Tpa1-like proline 4-hydroxylase